MEVYICTYMYICMYVFVLCTACATYVCTYVGQKSHAVEQPEIKGLTRVNGGALHMTSMLLALCNAIGPMLF